MKTNLKHICSFGNTISFAALIICVASNSLVQAQNIPPRIINGLFTPTNAERFFEDGRQILEREEQNIRLFKYLPSTKILKINDDLLKPNHDFRDNCPQKSRAWLDNNNKRLDP